MPFVLEQVLGSNPEVPSPDHLSFKMDSGLKAGFVSSVVSDLASLDGSDSAFYSEVQGITLEVQCSSDLSFWREAVSQVDSDLFRISGRPSVLVVASRDSALETPQMFYRLKTVRDR